MTVRPAFERGDGRLLRVLTAGRGVAWHLGDGATLRIDPRCRGIRTRSSEQPVVDYLRGRVRPGGCCVDVGAHVGFYALQMAHWTSPNGQVIAFEPNPAARGVLAANVALNHLEKRIAVEPLAVSDAAGTAALFHGGKTSALSRIGAPGPRTDAAPPIEVPVVTLDGYCAEHNLIPQWVLIDAEGLEMDVLAGATGLLVDRRCSFVIEMHPDLWSSGRQITAVRLESLLRTCGRTAIPLTGQRRVLDDYGTVAIP